MAVDEQQAVTDERSMKAMAVKAMDDAVRYPISPAQGALVHERFSYHTPVPDQIERYRVLREWAEQGAFLIMRSTPPSEQQTESLNRLQEVVMWANAAIAINE